MSDVHFNAMKLKMISMMDSEKIFLNVDQSCHANRKVYHIDNYRRL